MPNSSSPRLARSRAFDVVEDPLHFGAGEVRVNHQAGGLADVFFHAVALELLADLGGTAALPDDSVINRLAGFTLPDDGGFTLVGDTDRRDFIGADIGFASTSTSVELCDAQISIGSCSTQPGRG